MLPTFDQIIEFVELQKRLEHSLGFTCILVNMNQLEMVTSIHRWRSGRVRSCL